MGSKEIILIAAMDAQNGIGKDGGIPWKCKEDMQHFMRHTLYHPVVMGRKTFDSLPHPLAKRINLVVTRSAAPIERDIYHVGQMVTTEQAVEIGHLFDDHVYVIGGQTIYEQTMAVATRLIITHIDGDYGCDRRFPPIDPALWHAYHSESKFSQELGKQVTFTHYRRAK